MLKDKIEWNNDSVATNVIHRITENVRLGKMKKDKNYDWKMKNSC